MSKASKWRACPALGREISPADCGAQRQSRLACPANCPHNPFAPANYAQFLELEEQLDRQTMQQLARLTPDHAAIGRDIAAAESRGIVATNACFVWHIFFAEDAAGTTVAQRWEKSGAGLKNDERVMLRGKMQIRVALLETHRIFANDQVEAVDLLSPEPKPLILQDRGLAGKASRFSTLLSWIYPVPHYWRLCGAAASITDVGNFSPLEIVQEVTRHLGGPLSEPELRRWLAEHFIRFGDALDAVWAVRRRQMFSQLDAKWGRAVYELRASFSLCRQHLDTHTEIAPDELGKEEQDEGFVEGRMWFDRPPESKQMTLPGGRMTLGRVLLGQSHWRLQAFGAEKLARLRQQFERHLGDRVRFQGERLDDLGARLNARDPVVDETLIPPRLLENPSRLIFGTSSIPLRPHESSPEDTERELFRAADRAFLEEPVPALANRTPRQAAHDASLRPKLVQLMKQRVRGFDERNLQRGTRPSGNASEDINWMLRELELHELVFDPPPWRPPPPSEGNDDFPESTRFDETIKPDLNRPVAPPLPAAPFDFEEAQRRLEAAAKLFKTAAEAQAELDASGATVLVDAEELMSGLKEVDHCFAIPFLLHAWFALVPRGCRAPTIDFINLRNSFIANLRQLDVCAQAKTPKKLEQFFLSGPQPNLMLALLSGFTQSAMTAPKEIRPRPDAQPIILAMLKAIVEQLDSVLRPNQAE
jgi:hypothetical protein